MGFMLVGPGQILSYTLWGYYADVRVRNNRVRNNRIRNNRVQRNNRST